MRGPLGMLIGCLAVVLAAVGWGAWERHVGAQQAEARAHADSLLRSDSLKIAQIALQDAIRSKADSDSLQRLNVEIRTTKHLVSQARLHADSLAGAISGDSLVPRDTVQALVGAFRGERQAADSQIATLTTANQLLLREVAGKDSTIAALQASLTEMRGQLRGALAPASPGFLQRGADLVVKGLAVYGAVRLLGK